MNSTSSLMEIETEVPFYEELDDLLNDWKFKRKLILWLYYRKGMNQSDISKYADISNSTISKWLGRWKEIGSIEDEEGRGKKVNFTKKQEKMVIEKQNEDRFKTAASIQREMTSQGQELSYKQVLGIVNNTFESSYTPYKIELTKKNKQKRLDWIDQHNTWRDWKWDRVVWTDEKIFALYPQGLKKVVKIMFEESTDEFNLEKVPQGGEKKNVLGCNFEPWENLPKYNYRKNG